MIALLSLTNDRFCIRQAHFGIFEAYDLKGRPRNGVCAIELSTVWYDDFTYCQKSAQTWLSRHQIEDQGFSTSTYDTGPNQLMCAVWGGSNVRNKQSGGGIILMLHRYLAGLKFSRWRAKIRKNAIMPSAALKRETGVKKMRSNRCSLNSLVC